MSSLQRTIKRALEVKGLNKKQARLKRFKLKEAKRGNTLQHNQSV